MSTLSIFAPLLERPLIPVCAWCGKTRDEQAHWHNIDLHQLTNEKIEITHTICPTCSEQLLLNE